MCGIAGLMRLDGAPIEPGQVDRLLQPLAHRGPDGSGRYVEGPIGLGHRRLSILDPSEAGHQPMGRDGRWLVHNGEIYNFLELADELRALGHFFTTGTDTEVILAAFAAWGTDAFSRFNGMWALAIWDAPLRRLVLSRDRMGVKPLYLRESGRTVLFASEPRALLATDAGGSSPDPSLEAVRDFLVRGLVDHSEQTFIAGIRSLPAAHTLILSAEGSRIHRYWAAPALADDDRPVVHGSDLRADGERVDEFRALLDSSVRLRLRSDVPLGSCLSGGLDSSAIVTTAARVLDGLAAGDPDRGRDRVSVPRFAFHARFPGQVDESSFAQEVAAATRLTLVYASPAMEDPSATLEPVIAAQGEPFASTSIYAQYAVMEAARAQGLKVLLDGQGADELLGGYVNYLGVTVAGLVRRGRLLEAARELRLDVARGVVGPAAALRGAIRGVLSDRVNEQVRRAARGRWGIRPGPALAGVDSLHAVHREPGTLLAQRLWQAVAVDSLPALLRYEDRNSMAFGIEARVPFLDYRLVELSLRLPDRLRAGGGTTKVVLRRAAAGLVPARIIDRRDKVGFATPEADWLRAARTRVIERLTDGQVVRRGWISEPEMARMITDRRAWAGAGGGIWRAYVLEEWARQTWPDGAR